MGEGSFFNPNIVGLVLAIAALAFFVLRTKVHAFLAMLIAGVIAGLFGGLTPDAVVTSLANGFGKTLGNIGIVIGLGVMMGRLLEVSGAAEKIAYSLVKVLGKRKEEWALAVTGYIVSIPIFVDSAFVILYPIVKALAKTSGRSILTLGVALAGGLVVTHHIVPPTPGPLGVAGILGVDVGTLMLAGMALCVPCLIGIVFYAKWLAKKYPDFAIDSVEEVMPTDLKATYDQYMAEKAGKQLPSLFLSLLPIVAPIVLIFMKALVGIALTPVGTKADKTIWPMWAQVVDFLGTPLIALTISVLISIYTLSLKMARSETLDRMEEGIQACGIILLVTGAGGALGAVLTDTGTGAMIANHIKELPISAIMIPFLIATVVRLVQGSGTVSMITGATISAPILAGLPDVNMLLAALAATVGSLFFGSFNDSLFWVVNRMMGVKTPSQQTIVWSIPTTIAWAIGLVCLLIADMIW